MNNLSVPLAGFCDSDSCHLDAEIPALLAECVTSSRSWSGDESPIREVRCSIFGNETCIAWTPETVLNFTTGPFSTCSKKRTAEDLLASGEPLCPPGDFAVIFGEWVSSNAPGENGGDLTASTKHTVDCRVSYGTVNITQQFSEPHLHRTSFVKSTTPISDQGSLASLWQYGFLGHGGLNYSPYNFAYTRSTLNTMTPLSRYLVPLEISPDDVVNATAKVGRTIEANFDTTTLFAFARALHAARVHAVTYPPSESIWGYDPRVLLVLVFPFLAKVFVFSTHWEVQSGEFVIGYDPMLIARRADEVLGSSFVAGRRHGRVWSGGSFGLGGVGQKHSMV